MRIAIFTEIFDCGGADTFLVNLINNWPDAHDEFVIIANSNYPGLRLVEQMVVRPLRVIRHDMPTYAGLLGARGIAASAAIALSPVLRYVVLLFNTLALRPLLREANADVLMVLNGGYPGGDSCRAAGISWGLFSGKPPAVHNFHNIAQKAPWYLAIQEALVDRVLRRLTSRFVTVSRAAAASMDLRPGIAKNGAVGYIHNGIRSEPLQAASSRNIKDELGISRTTPLCLMLATYEPRKGHRFLFEAFKRVLIEVPDAHLLICGFAFPHELAHVEALVEEFGLGASVHLMEFRSDISALLENTDLLVVASQAYESFGFTSVEAMAHRVPVVATDVGGIPEVVADGEGGYCVSRHDPDAYARRMVSLLTDPEARRDQGERGYRRYRALFTAERMAANYSKLLSELNLHGAARVSPFTGSGAESGIMESPAGER